jgi:hypothetical protein
LIKSMPLVLVGILLVFKLLHIILTTKNTFQYSFGHCPDHRKRRSSSVMRQRSTSFNKNKNKNKKHAPERQEEDGDCPHNSSISAPSERPSTTPPVVNDESRLRKVLVRTGMGCCMVIFYCSMLRGGYMYCILVGVLTQVGEQRTIHSYVCRSVNVFVTCCTATLD